MFRRQVSVRIEIGSRLGLNERLRRSCQRGDVTRRVASLDRCCGTPLQLRASSWLLDSAMCIVLPSSINERIAHTDTHIHAHIKTQSLFPSLFLSHFSPSSPSSLSLLYLFILASPFSLFYSLLYKYCTNAICRFPSRDTWRSTTSYFVATWHILF